MAITLEQRVLAVFRQPDFEETEELSTNFQFRPDIVLKNVTTVRAFIIRKSNKIPLEFIDKFSEETKFENCSTEKFIAFYKKPDDQTISICTKEKQIGVCYLSKKTLVVINPVEKHAAYNRDKLITAPYEMPTAHIFFSSIEELDERIRGKKIVELINSKYKKPIYAHLIERDKKLQVMTRQLLWREILEGIYNDEFFLGILTEEFAAAVEEEIQAAIKKDQLENIILLVKNNDQTRVAWSALLTDIEIRFHARGRTVWYTKYDDLEDFEETLRKAIMELISKKYKDNGSTFL